MAPRIGQALKGAMLLDFRGAFGTAVKSMAKPKMTVNYPVERNSRSARFRSNAL